MLKTRKQYDPAVNIFIADASRMGCQLMTAALCRSRHRVAVVGYATNLEDSRSALACSNVDVAVIAVQLKKGAMAGFDLARETRGSNPEVRIIMMLDTIDRAAVIEAFRSGASGIFSRDESFELLCKAIHAVHQGQVWAGSKELRFLVDVVAEPVKAIRSPRLLTKREQGVVELVAEGFTNRDISRELNLSENTIRNYMFRIFNKVGTSNRLELARYAADRKEKQGNDGSLALRDRAS